MRTNDGPAVRRPQNGTQAHDTNRELELSKPAHVGATPFWDRPTAKPSSIFSGGRDQFYQFQPRSTACFGAC